MKDQVSRYEINRRVKAVLTRHAVDLTQLHYSSTGETVYLFGKLQKDPKGDFRPPEIEAMVRDLTSISQVRDLQFDLSNWTLLFEPGYLTISQKK